MSKMTVNVILGVMAIVAVVGAFWLMWPAAPGAKREDEMISIHVFNREGKLVGPIETNRLDLTDVEWQMRLTPEQFRVLRSHGTERPFCGTLLDNKREGVYTCVGCGLPLFSSSAKFNSRTGWPSFFQPIAPGNIAELTDNSHGMARTEIRCARCDGHLGHVFDDGPAPTGKRFCLNSEALNFTDIADVATLADPLADRGAHEKLKPDDPRLKTAVFAGGCFWCTEAVFEQLDGVADVTSGYTGGSKETATYKQTSSGLTGHAEAIRVRYDPKRISYGELLNVFFDSHDPTQLNGQGHDIGTQYRSAIFYGNEAERRIAEAKIRDLNASGKYPRKIVTTLEELKEFYLAEDYHQDFARKNPGQPYVAGQVPGKVCKVRQKYPGLVTPEKE
jgi:peptide methionine sulfoxide reductase msrA/msrB